MSLRISRLASLALPSAFLLGIASGQLVPTAARASEHDTHEHHHHHHPTQAADGYRRTHHVYKQPRVTLVRENGSKAVFPEELDDGRPVVLNFIYTSCTAVCPVLSRTFAEFQDKLGADAAGMHMVSISIDPEHDTPARLAEYAKRHRAGPQWHHYTGTVEASIRMQKAFGAYYGDKMNHRPAAYMRAKPGQPWIRLDGFATADDLLKEYRALTRTVNRAR
jgi:protein SCO1/2